MHEKSILSSESVRQFGQSLEMIRTSLLNLISFADNLIPEDLHKNGIKNYISETCKTLQKEKKQIITTVFTGDNNRLNENTEVTIFRIFTDIISFIITQYEPTEIIITINQSNELFLIDIVYNAQEFNLSNLSSSGIIEVAKIKSLIESVNGTFTFSRTKDNKNNINAEIKI